MLKENHLYLFLSRLPENLASPLFTETFLLKYENTYITIEKVNFELLHFSYLCIAVSLLNSFSCLD